MIVIVNKNRCYKKSPVGRTSNMLVGPHGAGELWAFLPGHNVG